MSVQFDEENSYSSGQQPRRARKRSFFVRTAMKLPFVKTERQANLFLVILAIIFFSISIALPARQFGLLQRTPPPPSFDDIPEEVRNELPPEF